jgi:hypothetical protein
VAGAGDVNGDGYDDLLVGAFGQNRGSLYYAGAAYLFLGGAQMDASADLTILGAQNYGELGVSVAGAGDLDGDGYDDFLVGEPYNSSGSMYNGAVYLFRGGPGLDAVPDMVVLGSENMEYVGTSVAGAGDLNGDGWPDIALGAPGSYGGGGAGGTVHLLYGGPAMDNSTDLLIEGHDTGEYFGIAVAPAGDINGDGSRDLLVGAYLNSSAGTYTGAAYAYFGGKSMDGTADIVLSGPKSMSYFGYSLAGGFDLNGDGIDDFAVGAPYDSSAVAYGGRAFVFFGGQTVNLTPDINLSGDRQYGQMGAALSGAPDLNGDGLDELLVGAPGYYGYYGSRLYIYGTVFGALNPRLEVASRASFGLSGYVNSTFLTPDLSKYINEYMEKQFPSGWDESGNTYCDIPLNVSAGSEGRITLRPANITYKHEMALGDFADALNAWIRAHRAEADAQGNLRVPLSVESATPGRVRFTNLDITIDEAPRLVQPIPDASLDEDSFRNDLLDLAAFFEDDFDSAGQLSFSVVSSTSPETVAVTIMNGRWLSADALEGDQNDNWTGTVRVVVRAEDHYGSGRSSNEFNITVRNVNDPPVITSSPPMDARGGDEWVYRMLADDGDRDRLDFRLAVSPDDMTINGSTGVITWIPQKWGRYPVAASVSDGIETVWQNFTLTVANRPPSITSVPPLKAFIGQPYEYAAAASDPDNDALRFTLVTGLEGFSIDPLSGLVAGVPRVLGAHELILTVSDGRAEAVQNYTLTVVWPNRSPYITSTAVKTATEGLPYVYNIAAYDNDKDPVEFSLAAGPAWLSIDASTGRLSGTPDAGGTFSVAVLVRDGRGGEGRQDFTLTVAESVPPSVTFPTPGTRLRGAAALSGTVVRGTHAVTRVEVRLDGGSWREAAHNGVWNLTLDTGRLRDGAHLVEVRAYDGREYSRTVNGTIEVDNSKTVQAGGISAGPAMVAVGLAVAVAAAAGVVVAMRKRREP